LSFFEKFFLIKKKHIFVYNLIIIEMIKIFALSLFFLLQIINVKSSNIVFYSKKGELFNVFINGIKQNLHPDARVKIVNLKARDYNIEIIFKNKNFGKISKKINLHKGYEMFFIIKKRKKNNRYIFKFKKEIVLSHTVETMVVFNNDNLNQTEIIRYYPSRNKSSNNNHNQNYHNDHSYYEDNYLPISDYPFLKNYQGNKSCKIPINKSDFEDIKKSIIKNNYEHLKLANAKQIIKQKCFVSVQVKEIMDIFDFDNSRLDFAIFAYDYTYDLGNYYKVNSSFEFEFSITRLNNHINKCIKK